MNAPHYAKEIADRFEELEEQSVSIAGRIMSKRSMGKASFFDVADASGRIQVYIKKDIVGEETYNQFKKWDIGDIVGRQGRGVPHQAWRNLHPCHRSNPAVQVAAAAAGKIPRPDQHRPCATASRYVDLIVNPEVPRRLCQALPDHPRAEKLPRLQGATWRWRPPVLHNVAGGAAARPFITHQQHPEHGHVPAHCAGTAPETPDCRRL